MRLDIVAAEDALMSAEAQVAGFAAEFEQQWNAPLIRTALAMLLSSLDRGTVESLVRQSPDLMARAIEELR